MTERRSVDLPMGEWVSGTSVNDERIRGFVRHYDSLTSMYAVTVVESDRKEIIGRTVFARASQVSALSVDTVKQPEVLRALIDLALEVRDKEWFYELTAELLKLDSKHGLQTAPA